MDTRSCVSGCSGSAGEVCGVVLSARIQEGCSACSSKKDQISWSASGLSASLLGSVHVPVGNCVSWGICFLIFSVLAKGQKCCVSRAILIFVDLFELGRKEMLVCA